MNMFFLKITAGGKRKYKIFLQEINVDREFFQMEEEGKTKPN